MKKEIVADYIEAKEIRLVDKNGDIRMLLTVLETSVHLNLTAPDGTPRLSLTLDADGTPHIALISPTGGALVAIGSSTEGESGFSINSSDGKLAMRLGCLKLGDPNLGSKDQPIPRIQVFDHKGKSREILPPVETRLDTLTQPPVPPVKTQDPVKDQSDPKDPRP